MMIETALETALETGLAMDAMMTMMSERGGGRLEEERAVKGSDGEERPEDPAAGSEL